MRHHLFIFYGISLLVILILVSGCQKANPRGDRKALNKAAINLGADPRSMDPALSTDIPSARAVSCLIDGLFRVDDNGDLQNALVESWDVSPDGKIYDFMLRDALWSNGDPVTSDDFYFNWVERVLDPGFGAEYAYMLFYIHGAKEFYDKPEMGSSDVGILALSPKHLQVRLKSPAPFFLQMLAHHIFFPVNRGQVESLGDKWSLNPETYVGNGAFTLADYKPGASMIMKKNPKYWNLNPDTVEEIEFRMIQESSTALIAYENGELDMNPDVPRAQIERLKALPDLNFSSAIATYYLEFNCQNPPLDNPDIRRALAMAINRGDIVNGVTRAGEKIALSLCPPQLYPTPLEEAYPDASFEEARQLLAGAGYLGGDGFPQLTYLYNTDEGHKKIAQVVKEVWSRELGIEVRIENQEFKVVLDNKQEGNFDIARAGWVADFADPINFLEMYDSRSQNNTAHWHDQEYDRMLDASRAEADNTKRIKILKNAEKYFISKQPIAPIYFYNTPYLVSPETEGLAINPVGQIQFGEICWRKDPAKH
jgi:oligopeptide transport system substrate-binding protein